MFRIAYTYENRTWYCQIWRRCADPSSSVMIASGEGIEMGDALEHALITLRLAIVDDSTEIEVSRGGA